MIKQCARCGTNFDGRGNVKYCSACRPEVYREKQKRARDRHRAKDPALIKHETPCTCVRCNKEFTGHWNSKYCDDCKVIVGREQHAANSLRYRQRHPEKVKPYQNQYSARYYAEHREHCTAYARQYYAEHCEQCKASALRRYVKRRRKLKAEKFRAHLRAVVLKREQTEAKKRELYPNDAHWTDKCTLYQLSM